MIMSLRGEASILHSYIAVPRSPTAEALRPLSPRFSVYLPLVHYFLDLVVFLNQSWLADSKQPKCRSLRRWYLIVALTLFISRQSSK
jgi:hypothetical protein